MKYYFTTLKCACLLACLIMFSPSQSFSQLTYPTKYPTAVIPHNGDSSRFPFLYMPMEYQDNAGQDTFKLYYVKKTTPYKYYLARSIDYGITWTDTQRVTTYSHEPIIKVPDSTKLYMGYGRWVGTISYMSKAESTDGGFTFTDSSIVMLLGEDKSFLWNEDTGEYWGYVRPFPVENSCCFRPGCISIGDGVRKIALMKNSTYFPNSNYWSARNIILEVDTNDYMNSASPDFRTQIYYMQVFRNEDDWWGLIGMYRVGDNGGENNPYPFSDSEYTVDVELVWSDNGEEWFRTNNRQPILALHDSINQVFAVGNIVQDSVYFYSSESTLHHSHYYTNNYCGAENNAIKQGKYFSIYLYKMSIDKLNEWRPPSVVNINCAVEGFLNTGTGKHNIRDTLSAQLRNSTSPYGVASTINAVIDSVTFLGNFNFPHVAPGNYYLTIYGRNSLETWSASTISISNSSDAVYDFTTGYSKAYGGNLILKGSEYCIYSGDVNNDNFIDGTDEGLIDNDILYSVSGYVNTDLNGDMAVDISDAAIAGNNSFNLVGTISP
ncbi:MAG: hypothetical protein WAT71_15585 [Ignavibacteria bacterium]